MPDHVIMGYKGPSRLIERSGEGGRVRSYTRTDSVTVIPAGQTARWDIYGQLQVVHLYVSPERLTRSWEVVGNGAVPDLRDGVARRDPTLSSLIGLLAAELEADDRCALYADTLSEAVCLHLLRPYAGRPRVVGEPVRAGLAPWQVSKVKERLADFSLRPSLRQLGDLVGLSPKHVCTAFHLATGTPPHAWSRALREARAKALLADRSKPLTDIALELGFESHSAFSAAFRRDTGRTPSEWRISQEAGQTED